MINSKPDNSLSGNLKSLPSAPLRRTENASAGSGPTINVVGSLRRHWYVAALVFLVLLGCGAFVLWKRAKPDYESHSVVYLSPKFPKILADDSEVELPYDSYVQDQAQTVTRHDIIADAIAKLPYAVRHRGGPALPYEIQVMQQGLEVKRVGSTYEMSIGLHGTAPNDLATIVNTVTETYVDRMKGEEF